MGGRPLVSQEDFDAAVASNMEDFGMEGDEAVAAAVEEFEIQGADLSGVVKQQRATIDKHPLADLTKRTRANLTGGDLNLMNAILKECRSSLAGQKEEELALSLAVAGREETVPVMLDVVAALPENPEDTELAFVILRILLGTDSNRSSFLSSGGVALLLATLRSKPGLDTLVLAAVESIEAAVTKCEENKSAFMDGNIGELFRDLLSREEIGGATVKAISRAVRKLTTADDNRPVVSRAFQNSRALAKEGLHLQFLTVLRRSGRASPDVAAACCSAMRKLAANDELCSELAEAGGVVLALQVLQSSRGSAICTAAASGLLRQMAGSDAVKLQVVELGGLEAAVAALEAHSGSPSAMEQTLGLVAAVTLRCPEAASAALQAGAVDAILEVMSVLQQQWAQRQGCMALRNLVARTPEARPALLEKGAEQALRAAKAKFPEACQDVGSAALRDLGLEDYNA